ncbi:nuclear transport factor 2 family protein [Occultella kanbiaonis]|uniref:nuclear transport factor 2 family protein n=1 Tax=Occultella kanbiaonis TaxID=2675754 RepID=UPI0013D0D5B8|nr:nuclear transport factor 2 family protein [Occultella kanbiaonis]
MPWVPDLFNARFIADLARRQATDHIAAVPYFDGILAGAPDALLRSFTGEPELHHPVRGRIKGRDAFTRYALDTADHLRRANADVEAVALIVTPTRTVEEVVLRYEADRGKVELPIAIVTDRDRDGLHELRIYHSTWPITGAHANRPPLLQPGPDVHAGDAVGGYQHALAAGDVAATVAAFEPDGIVREPAGGAYTHTGADELTQLYTLFFSNGGGIPLEHCSVTDDGHACALEYNVTRWGTTDLPPEAGVAVYTRGGSGRLASARIYDDTDPPL